MATSHSFLTKIVELALARPVDSDPHAVRLVASPADLTVSMELSLAQRSLVELLQPLTELQKSPIFKNSATYLLVPKPTTSQANDAASRAPSHGQDANPVQVSQFLDTFFDRRSLPKPGAWTLTEHSRSAMMIMESDVGDLRFFTRSDNQVGLFAALWLSQDLPRVAQQILAVLHHDGENHSLRTEVRNCMAKLHDQCVSILQQGEIEHAN